MTPSVIRTLFLSALSFSLCMLLSSSRALSRYHLAGGFGRRSLWAFSPDPCMTSGAPGREAGLNLSCSCFERVGCRRFELWFPAVVLLEFHWWLLLTVFFFFVIFNAFYARWSIYFLCLCTLFSYSPFPVMVVWVDYSGEDRFLRRSLKG